MHVQPLPTCSVCRAVRSEGDRLSSTLDGSIALLD